MTTRATTQNAQITRFQQIALAVGGIGAVLCVVGAFLGPEQLFRSYLYAYMLWFGLGMGSLALLMLQFLVGGAWGLTIRRFLEAGALTIPALAILFIPILVGMQSLYPWMRADVVAKSEFWEHKALYLNMPFFLLRTVVFFAIWSFMALTFNRWSRQQDQGSSEAMVRRFQRWSAAGLVVYALTITFAVTDWVMSLEEEFMSTIFGGRFIVGQGLTTLALMIITLTLLRRSQQLPQITSERAYRDIGTLMFAFVVLWAYTAYAEYGIIWSANIAEFTPYFLHRTRGGWEFIPMVMIVAQFVLPFVLLLQPRIKKNIQLLVILAAWIFVLRLADLYWIIAPSFYPDALTVNWTDAATLLGIGGLWLGAYAWALQRKPLVAVNDHRIDLAVSQAHAHSH